MLTALLLLLSGESLRFAHANIHHITGRILLGMTFSIAQLASLAYASEVPIIKLRSFLTFLVGYVNAVSVLFATMAATIIPSITDYRVNRQQNISRTIVENEISDGEDAINYIISKTGTIIMAIGMLVLILTPFLARESVPFLVRKRNFDEAQSEFERSCAGTGSAIEILNDFQHWKLYILSEPKATMNIFKVDNFERLRQICLSRLLSMLFSSVYMSAMIVRMMNMNSEYYDYAQRNMTMMPDNATMTNETTNPIHEYDQSYDITLLLGCKSFQFGLGIILLIISFKCNIEKFCYKMSFTCGFGILFLYVIFCVWSQLIAIPYILMLVFMVIFFMDIMICLMLRVHIDMYHYVKIGQAFDDDNNRYKIWSLVFVNLMEHVMHIFLLVQIYWYSAYPLLFTGFGILFISFWFLKRMRQGEKVQPWECDTRPPTTPVPDVHM